MNVREKRLHNDFKALSELINNSGETLAIISTSGNPPYQYVIEYRCRGIERLNGNKPVFRTTHQVQISREHLNLASKENLYVLLPLPS